MSKNMGTADRVIRIAIALAIGVLYFMNVISGTVAIVLGIVAVLFVVTSFTGVCLGYIPFKLSTRKGTGDSGPVL
jgi:hypothetical protein